MQLSHPVIGESSVLLGHTAPFPTRLLNVLEKFETTLPSLKSLSLSLPPNLFPPLPLPWAAEHHLGKIPKEKSHGGGCGGGMGQGRVRLPLGGSVSPNAGPPGGAGLWSDASLTYRDTDPKWDTICHGLNKRLSP